MKKKFLSVIAICAILSSVAASYCSAVTSDSSSSDELSSSSSIPGSAIINKSQSQEVDFSQTMPLLVEKWGECNNLKKQIDSLQEQNSELMEKKRELFFQSTALKFENKNLEAQIRKLQKKHPFIRLIKIAGVVYIVYDVYNKNSSEDNFNFVKTFAKESADQLKSNVLCEDSANKILCVAGQKAASLAGYVKGFSSAELCVLTNGSLCPEAVKVSAQEYLAGDQIKTLSFIK